MAALPAAAAAAALEMQGARLAVAPEVLQLQGVVATHGADGAAGGEGAQQREGKGAFYPVGTTVAFACMWAAQE